MVIYMGIDTFICCTHISSTLIADVMDLSVSNCIMMNCFIVTLSFMMNCVSNSIMVYSFHMALFRMMYGCHMEFFRMIYCLSNSIMMYSFHMEFFRMVNILVMTNFRFYDNSLSMTFFRGNQYILKMTLSRMFYNTPVTLSR